MTTNPNHPNATSQADTTNATTDFGYRSVPKGEKKTLVKEVFESVAGKYDVMNDLMSLGLHRAWKRDFINLLAPRAGLRLLDLAGGTGDITFGWLKRGGGPAVLSDINAAMLEVGRKRAIDKGLIERVEVCCADAEALPFPDASFDRVSMAFGLRNCTDKLAVLKEARRVLKPGGRFLCLEFSKVTVPALAQIYDVWSFQALPRMGRMVAGDADSYQYLAESIRMFPPQAKLEAMMREAGLERVSHRNLTGGIVAIHSGWRL
ncbi:bifunctional demethylmenaquinone methyltransferase/2-methoxy-6-polyprenyl-1,4-benzoquinol methylase UbiE [Formicincola oecophyllae]|uniref:Ubiquinone/menaquinone biosynthesis C-methyltransferase UbiE n=1 Tax=Formicincola oecophyllae TaxID=2558361 RepID=A0A4Y6UCX2_9PROT|nr:bifunctional demethylmenaquinone methyltransferase/2-methoxy-6-polyprenyl-1,4-benzoquinol methylase UbiE [Formicincola oecophyllae]QDH14231.1 bifunctional demethylmenaquinone methyltransferase/2-methoxy-6-polyprenyl-1,4-benzoquinol methylase UbiE [Formicincola oecophyllae]